MSTRVFSNISSDSEWSTPRVLTDTANIQIEYSKESTYIKPDSLQSYYDTDPINYENNWRDNNIS